MRVRQQEPLTLSHGPRVRLNGLLCHSGQAGPDAVLFVHGFGSTHYGEKARAVEAACARRGWTFVSFDFRGHGLSSGNLLELSGRSLQEDLGVVADWLGTQGIERLFLVGSSMGGWTSAWFCLLQPGRVAACAGIAPAFDFVKRRASPLSEEEVRQWRQTGRHRVQSNYLDVEIGTGLLDELDVFPLTRLQEGWTTPLLIFHGMADEVVPWTDSLEFVQRSHCSDVELRLYKDGDHRLLARKDEMAEGACQFFGRWWQGHGHP
jgi:pimeloyl-ACP methyl ester carboxylesterase